MAAGNPLAMAQNSGESVFARLFDNPSLSDVTIHFNGQQVKAHKVILAAHSDHFNSMFAGGFSEASAAAINLHDDDPEALRGLLAFCYGLYYNGNDILTKIEDDEGVEPHYHGETPQQHLQYIINLYVVAGKYMAPDAQAHAKQNFAACMLDMTQPDDASLIVLRPGQEFLSLFELVARLLYEDLSEVAKGLRPAFVKAVRSHAGQLVKNEQFKELMIGTPELAFDVMALATRSKEDGKKRKKKVADSSSLSPGPPTPRPQARGDWWSMFQPPGALS